jgi:hexosaminidase
MAVCLQENLPFMIAPVHIGVDLVLSAALFLPGSDKGVGITTQEFQKVKDYHVTYHSAYNEKWVGAGDVTLIDYYRGEESLGHRWQGFLGNDMDVVIDLKEMKEVESVALGCLQNEGNWVFFPNYIEVAVSEDGENFTKVGRLETIPEWQRLVSKTADLTVSFPKTRCRYIKVFAKNIGYNPVWHSFAGTEAWLFVDEIIIK